jgi:hypothetical protein
MASALDHDGFLSYMIGVVQSVIRSLVQNPQSAQLNDSMLSRLEYCRLNVDRIVESVPPRLRGKYNELRINIDVSELSKIVNSVIKWGLGSRVIFWRKGGEHTLPDPSL